KKGLKRAGSTGTRAGVGGYTYLLEPLWWAGMVTMIVGEVANFVAYVYAPAVLVTPLGALSIIISAVLAHFLLKERLQKMGVVGCVSCIVGSVIIVIHAPQEHTPSSVQEIWILATQPAFLIYVVASLSIVLAFILHFEPRCGQTNILIYLGICSLMGSLTVVSIKAIGIAIKLTLEGVSQIAYPQTWFFFTVAVICVITQLNYLNKVSMVLSLLAVVLFTGKYLFDYNGVVPSSTCPLSLELTDLGISIVGCNISSLVHEKPGDKVHGAPESMGDALFFFFTPMGVGAVSTFSRSGDT
ncbi:putative magnesium transporter nipa6, partial [Quercus suber]